MPHKNFMTRREVMKIKKLMLASAFALATGLGMSGEKAVAQTAGMAVAVPPYDNNQIFLRMTVGNGVNCANGDQLKCDIGIFLEESRSPRAGSLGWLLPGVDEPIYRLTNEAVNCVAALRADFSPYNDTRTFMNQVYQVLDSYFRLLGVPQRIRAIDLYQTRTIDKSGQEMILPLSTRLIVGADGQVSFGQAGMTDPFSNGLQPMNTWGPK